MKGIEKMLSRKKEEIFMVEAPEEMEDCLKSALQKKRRRFPKGAIAAAFVAALILAYSFDSIAYYGKKFMGYDFMRYGNLRELLRKAWDRKLTSPVFSAMGLSLPWML